MNHVKKLGVGLLAGLLFCLMAACGQERTVTIQDGATRYEVTISEGQTVGRALEEAGITLDSRDAVSPAPDTKISEVPESIAISRYARVSIRDADRDYAVEITGGTVADALKAAGITLGEADYTSIPETDSVWDGMTVEILHQKTVTVKADGETREWKTNAATVKELLQEIHLTLGENDTVSPEPETALAHGNVVTVYRISYEEATETEEIPYETEERESPDMDLGTEEVTQAGVPGRKEVVYRVTMEDGRETAREILSETVLSEPVTEIITRGTAEAAAGNGSQNQRYVVSKEAVPDCADGSHGYYVITYSDGSVEYEVY